MKSERIPLLRTPSGILNKTPNVLVLYRLHDFQRRADVNFWLALISLICCGINIVLLILNFLLLLHHADKEGPRISEEIFHLIEFWTTFIYALVDAYALITSPRSLLSIHENTLILKVLFFFNVVASLVPALLISVDFTYFEHTAHELEYINEFSLSLVSFILFTSLTNPKTVMSQQESTPPTAVNENSNNFGPILTVGISIIVAAITFLVYNFGAEVYAHFFEFTFNIISCLITFWFCIDNRFVAELEVAQILFGQHTAVNCTICDTNIILLEQRENLQHHLQQQQKSSQLRFGFSRVMYESVRMQGGDDNNDDEVNTNNRCGGCEIMDA